MKRLALILALLSSSAALAQASNQASDQEPNQAPDQAVELSALAPPTDVVVADVPNDAGKLRRPRARPP